ncbi:MAG TPA: SusD/RagB family nutrient-binding outer membrane lipoprotein, partial [Chitinophagales bacterium]|nr:SusD/RagB family nutrient-binding outer membrane lipoprotein [Chitinophagales bacterium]
MKKYNLNKLIVLVSGLVMLIASSCTKILDINEDPNNSPSSTPQLALPAAQVGLAMAIGDWNYRGAIWAQYWTGGQGVSTDNIEKYNMTGTDPETSWSRAYSLTLTDLKFLVTGDQPIYAGIGKILTAYTYQMLVDLFGAVPFSEALKGQPSDGGIVAPKFDSEQDVYAALIPMIDEAIANLHESGTLIQTPGSEDLIYGGDLDSWEAFANTLKLKILVRQGEAKKAEALALLTSGAAF